MGSRPDVVMEYCVRDTHLPLDILGILSHTRKEALASVSLTAVETALNGTTSQWIDSLVMRLADKESIAVPMTNAGPGREIRLQGATCMRSSQEWSHGWSFLTSSRCIPRS